jgi:tetratricopeptide (TPR) repeat protein
MPYEDTLAAFRRGENVEAARLAARDVAEAKAAGDLRAHVDGLCMLARVALRDGDLVEVVSRAEKAQQLARGSQDRHLQRMPVHLRAVAARMAGRYSESRELYLQSIALNEALGEHRMAAAEHRNLAYVELRAGNLDRARELFAEAVIRLQNVDATTMTPYLTFDQATIAALDGDYETASIRLSAAQRQWEEKGVVPDPDDAAEVAHLQRKLSR